MLCKPLDREDLQQQQHAREVTPSVLASTRSSPSHKNQHQDDNSSLSNVEDLDDINTLDLENINQSTIPSPLPTRKIPDTPLPPVSKLISRIGSFSGKPPVDDTVEDGIGTNAFFPPEACVPGGKYSGMKADIWASGVTLYMFLYGRVPFQSEDQAELFQLIREKEVEFPITLGRKPISSDAIVLLKNLLQKNPNRRPNIQKMLSNI